MNLIRERVLLQGFASLLEFGATQMEKGRQGTISADQVAIHCRRCPLSVGDGGAKVPCKPSETPTTTSRNTLEAPKP